MGSFARGGLHSEWRASDTRRSCVVSGVLGVLLALVVAVGASVVPVPLVGTARPPVGSAASTPVLSGVEGSLGTPGVLADGSWRVVPEWSSDGGNSLTAVWRSSEGASWERVATPGFPSQSAVGVADDGSLMVAARQGSTGLFSYRYVAGVWGPAVSVRISSSGSFAPRFVVSDGSTWVIVTGGQNVST